MKKLFVMALLAGSMILCGNGVHAQGRICGNELLVQETMNDPAAKARLEAYFEQYDAENKAMAEQTARSASKGTGTEYHKAVIPVVFHIVLTQAQIDQLGGTAGVVERVNSQLVAVNADFNGNNIDIANVPQSFKPLVGKANIEFVLAKRDPQGKAKWGIVYQIKDPSFQGFSSDDTYQSIKRKSLGGSDPWDNTKYLNIWVTLIKAPGAGQGQVLGYAFNNVYSQQKYGTPEYGGVVLHYLTLGKRTNIMQTFYSQGTDKGRTLTHELGHYFNLWHIWGKSTASGQKSCVDDDGIQDTPEQEQSNTQCPPGFQANCTNKPHPGGEMYMNFMDYSGDDCIIMFTQGQVDRMRTETAPGGEVHSLTQHPELTLWPADVSAVEYNNKVEVGPNPSSGRFNVYFYDKYDHLDKITVSNNFGQVIKQLEVTDQQQLNYNFDLSNAAAGMYIV
ncbi:MAG TPA: M43 family zinc metalloprotease, partial [Flavipsychrobacter sp.]|nr:M43 family zinc metalloprotease [Flavipsychrobacter sp.]